MIDDTMIRLWVAKNELDSAARTLAEDGHQAAADELRREASKLGDQLLQIEGVISDYPEIKRGDA